MMKLSKYIHIYKKKNIYCYYHSLKMLPIYLDERQNDIIKNYLSNKINTASDPSLINVFIKNKFIVKNNNEDEKQFNKVKAKFPKPAITVAYFILSEQCNLACKYCFLGNATNKCKKFEVLSKEIAELELDYFIKQSNLSNVPYDVPREIIFYGGEPLIGYKTMKYIVNLVNEKRANNKLPFNILFSIVTNGVLINDDVARFFKENNIAVSLSLDGPDSDANSNRVYRDGKIAYNEIIRALNILSKNKVNFGLSLTLSESAMKTNIKDLIAFLNENKIKNLNFNTLLYANSLVDDKTYYKKAAKYITTFWDKTKDKNIYEDRMIRKIDAFTDRKFYYSDCAAVSGCQIVFLPNGDIGICHGNLENKKGFNYNIKNDVNLNKNAEIHDWTMFSPIMRKECKYCPAISVCGGGCPLNAELDVSSNAKLDKGFCIHSKTILKYMIWELYDQMIKGD